MELLASETVEDILLRVPAKSLARCKCVCKPWLQTIEHPDFTKIQFNRVSTGEIKFREESDLIVVCNKKSLKLFDSMHLLSVNGATTKPGKFNVESNELGEIWVMGSVKGFLCLSNSYGFVRGEKQSDYLSYIYNPITKERVELPKITFPIRKPVSIVTGFGFVDSTSEFKVVKIISWNDDFESQSEVLVHTLGSTSWRKVECPFSTDLADYKGEHIDGIIYFSNTTDEEPGIMSFNLEDEDFSRVLLPGNMSLQEGGLRFCLGVLEGCLSITNRSFKDRFEILVTEVNDVSSFWTTLFCVQYNNSGLTIANSKVKPLVLRKNGEVVCFNDKIIFSCNPKNGECKLLEHGPLQLIDNTQNCYLEICSYIASSFHLSQYFGRSSGVEN